MADERDVLLAGFVGDGEDGVARNQRLEFDEVDAAALQVVDRAAAIVRSRDRDRTGKTRLRAIEHGAGDDHARADQGAGGDFFAPLLKHFQVAAHIAHAGYAVGDEQRQRDVFAARKPVAEDGVDVHVPEAGDEELAGAVHMCPGQFYAHTPAGAGDRFDFSVANYDGAARLWRSAGSVDDGDVVDDQIGRGRRLCRADRGEHR